MNHMHPLTENPSNGERYYKPPIGLLPRRLYWEVKEKTEANKAERHQAVKEAIERYLAAGKQICHHWLFEYNEYCREKERGLS